ncbi:MAG: helix-turn-helix domain-containing protein [Oscillospiraceae bacterium]|nr:helix-turn-helix domain-containing protein [Oscillospiraceae bacterium]
MGADNEKQAPFSTNPPEWRVLQKVAADFLIVYKQTKDATVFAPIFIDRFVFQLPCKLTDAQRFMLIYPDPAKIPTTADKLRYYRYKNALLQRDVADHIGINRQTYAEYESTNYRQYDPDKLKEIAVLFDIPVDNLLDDYNRFLLNQGDNVRAIRKKLKLTQNEFAVRMGVHASTAKRWEWNEKLMFKQTYEKMLILA